MAVAVAAVDFKNCLLFILPSRKKVQVRQPLDTIAGVIAEVILLYHAKLRNGKQLMAAIESSEIQPASNTRTGHSGNRPLFVARRLQPEYN